MIEIVNEHPHYRINRTNLARLLTRVVSVEQRKVDILTVLLVTDRKIAKLHGQYLDDPTPTDVLTFDLSNSKEISGDIVISLDTAKQQATEFHVTIAQETARLAVHGLLHLCGMSDKTPAKRKMMHLKENEHLLREGWLEGKAN